MPLLLHLHHSFRLFLKVGVLGLLDRDTDAEDCSAIKLAGSLVFLAHGITTIVADAEAVTAEGELGGLCLHRALSNDPTVDIELCIAKGFTVLARLLAGELKTESMFA